MFVVKNTSYFCCLIGGAKNYLYLAGIGCRSIQGQISDSISLQKRLNLTLKVLSNGHTRRVEMRVKYQVYQSMRTTSNDIPLSTMKLWRSNNCTLLENIFIFCLNSLSSLYKFFKLQTMVLNVDFAYRYKYAILWHKLIK